MWGVRGARSFGAMTHKGNRLMSLIFARRPSPSMAVALAALFVSLGGVGYAAGLIGSGQIKDNSVRSKDIRNRTIIGKDVKGNSLGGAEINEGTLGQVAGAATAGSAQTAETAQHAQTAQSAETAQNAQNLGGSPAGAYARNGAEPVHVIGAPGEIQFNTGWGSPASSPTDEVPGYWKDPAGTVHLRGAAGRSSGTATTMFALPPGYRPKLDQWFVTYGSSSSQAYVTVKADGEIVWFGGADDTGAVNNSGYVGLSTVTFRADQ